MNRRIALMSLMTAAALAPAAMNAQRHPRYLRARTDLRTAQLFMRVREEPNVARNLVVADREVEAAIYEIDVAAVLDRKDLVDRPPIDANLARKDRFRKIVDLLRSARADIEREEDNPRAREWRNRAFQHIDESLNAVRRAAVDARIDRELGF
ncbi:MAG TPA: hypothetical protein VIY49_36755 [Bryobacteraceae bacterium]